MTLWERYDALRREDVWSEMEEYPRLDWRREVRECNTNLGYWDWVYHQIEDANSQSNCRRVR